MHKKYKKTYKRCIKMKQSTEQNSYDLDGETSRKI